MVMCQFRFTVVKMALISMVWLIYYNTMHDFFCCSTIIIVLLQCGTNQSWPDHGWIQILQVLLCYCDILQTNFTDQLDKKVILLSEIQRKLTNPPLHMGETL